MRYAILRPNGEYYRIDGITQGDDSLEAAKDKATDLASARWNQCCLKIWDSIGLSVVASVLPRPSSVLCAPPIRPRRKRS